MKVSASALLLAASLGVSAHPSGHAHQHAHRAIEERDFVMAQKPEPTTSTTSTTPPKPTADQMQAEALVQPSSSSSSAAPTTSSASGNGGNGNGNGNGNGGSGGQGQGHGTYTPFCNGQKTKRASLSEIKYKGNVGSSGNYGCNLMLVQSNVANQYDYQVKIDNAASKAQECVCFLKIGPSGGVNGFFDGNEALRFNVPAGGTQYVVADDNTQGGCSCGVGSVPVTGFGEFASSWVEFDFGNESNNGWSGADASCLVAAAQNLDIPGIQVCGDGTCSTINPGGTGKNAFLGGMEAQDGLGLNMPSGKAKVDVTIGYQG